MILCCKFYILRTHIDVNFSTTACTDRPPDICLSLLRSTQTRKIQKSPKDHYRYLQSGSRGSHAFRRPKYYNVVINSLSHTFHPIVTDCHSKLEIATSLLFWPFSFSLTLLHWSSVSSSAVAGRSSPVHSRPVCGPLCSLSRIMASDLCPSILSVLSLHVMAHNWCVQLSAPYVFYNFLLKTCRHSKLEIVCNGFTEKYAQWPSAQTIFNWISDATADQSRTL